MTEEEFVLLSSYDKMHYLFNRVEAVRLQTDKLDRIVATVEIVRTEQLMMGAQYDERLKKLEEQITNLSLRMEMRFEALEKRIDHMEMRFEALEKRIDHIV